MLCILRICIQHVNTRLGSTDATERMGTDAGEHAVLLCIPRLAPWGGVTRLGPTKYVMSLS